MTRSKILEMINNFAEKHDDTAFLFTIIVISATLGILGTASIEETIYIFLALLSISILLRVEEPLFKIYMKIICKGDK